jgi:hypothetical protein
MISPLDSSFDPSALGLALPQAAEAEELGQEEFLRLMMTQLRNQDPFKPMESGEFLGQLAQFGTVTGLGELQQSFEGLARRWFPIRRSRRPRWSGAPCWSIAARASSRKGLR